MGSMLADLLAADGQPVTDPRAGAGGGVVAFDAAESADGEGDEWQDRVAGEVWLPLKVVMIIGARMFQIGLPSSTVP